LTLDLLSVFFSFNFDLPVACSRLSKLAIRDEFSVEAVRLLSTMAFILLVRL